MIKDVHGYEDLYSVTDNGDIISKRTGNVMSVFNRAGWYYSIKLCRNGDHKSFKVHRIVAKAFIDNPFNLRDVNHKNGIKTDNRVENLEWMSRSENIKHSYRELNRNISKGETHPKSKILIDKISGVFYSCIREAAEAKGVHRNIMKCALRKKKEYLGISYA